jgi:hypothetical protein
MLQKTYVNYVLITVKGIVTLAPLSLPRTVIVVDIVAPAVAVDGYNVLIVVAINVNEVPTALTDKLAPLEFGTGFVRFNPVVSIPVPVNVLKSLESATVIK